MGHRCDLLRRVEGCDVVPCFNGLAMKIEEFYSDENRKRSGETPLAQGWRSDRDPEANFNLFWVVETGEVCALRIGPVAMGPGAPKPYLVYLPRMVTVGREEQEIAIVGQCERHDVVMDLVTAATNEQRTIEWLKQQLQDLADQSRGRP